MKNEEFSNIQSNDRKLATMSFYGVVLAIVGLLMISCAQPGAVAPPGAKDPYAHLDADEKIAMSDVLADEGEEILGYDTMNNAWGKFSEALQLNPANHRAALWKEILKPLLETKGIVARVRPLYMKQENGLERYARLLEGLDKNSSPGYRRFMTDGPSDIDTDEKFVEWLDRSIVSLDALRSFIRANKDRAYALHAPSNFVSTTRFEKKDDGSCGALAVMSTKFAACSESGMLNFKLNRADLEGIQFMVSIQMLQLSALYAYKFNPIPLTEAGETYKTTESKVRYLTKGYDGGLLARNRLKLANSVLADAIVAQRWVIQNQDTVCKNGKDSLENRPGFLMSTGFCISKDGPGDAAKVLEVLETMAIGKSIQVDMRFARSPIMIYPMKFFNEPPKDGQSMMPVKYNKNGDAILYDEAVYAPYFEKGTINDVVRAQRVKEIYQHRLSRWWQERAEKQGAEYRAVQLKQAEEERKTLEATSKNKTIDSGAE